MRPLDGALALASLLCAGGTSHRTAPPSVVFLHVPKTGGASALEYLLPCRDRIRVLYGAHEQTLSRVLGARRNASAALALRHPADRVVSEWHWSHDGLGRDYAREAFGSGANRAAPSSGMKLRPSLPQARTRPRPRARTAGTSPTRPRCSRTRARGSCRSRATSTGSRVTTRA